MLIFKPNPTQAADETLLLDVQINGYSTGKIGEFTQRDNVLLSRRVELSDLGFRVPDAASSASDLIPLSDLPGLTWRLDQASQTLYITAAAADLQPTLLQVPVPSGAESKIESGIGATLNYDISAISTSGQTVANGLFDFRAFSPWGVVSSGLLARTGGGPGVDEMVRLDSTYTYSSPDTNRRYLVGDVIAGSVGWTRPIRLAGMQITSDFSMRPDLVTFPLPSISGSAAVPSTLDVLANGTRLFSHQVDAGPFEIPQLPVSTGAGTISMTLTNALGRQVVMTLPFYAASTLLAPGLQTYSVQAGLVRRNFGGVSNDYGDPAATAIYRRGLSSTVTVEGSAEGTTGAFMTGAGVVANVADLVVANAAVAGSTGSAGAGMQVTLGVQRLGRIFSFGASATMADRNFRDVAAIDGDPAPQLQLSVNAGLSFGRFGSASVIYAGVDSNTAPAPIKVYITPVNSLNLGAPLPAGGIAYFQPPQRTHILSASYSVQVNDVSIYATGFRGFSGGSGNGIQVGLTIPLGVRSSASGSGSRGSGGGGEQVQVVQSTTAVGDFGYQAYASTGNSTHEFVQMEYRAPFASLTTGVDRIGRQTSLHAESAGALSAVDGRLFASETINDSFAVVDTNGVANVHVLSENRAAGSTDSTGLLLVPDLRSFDVNHIAIAPLDIPPDITLDTATREMRPQDRSGVVIKFPVRISHGALLRLVDEAGVPLRVGSTAALLRPAAASVPVGYGGEAYIEDLKAHNELAVALPDGRRCRAAFDYRAAPGDLPIIGPLTCREQIP